MTCGSYFYGILARRILFGHGILSFQSIMDVSDKSKHALYISVLHKYNISVVRIISCKV